MKEIILFFLLLSTTAWCAADESIDLYQQIELLKMARTATVVLVPERWFFDRRLDESGLKEGGCTYTTRDPALVSSLVELIKRADVAVASNVEGPCGGGAWGAWGAHEGIFLNLSNETEVKFLLGRNFIGQNARIRGEFSLSDTFKIIHVTTERSLIHDLMQWAVQTGEPEVHNARRQTECKNYIH
ncbi:MAG: hypothetical protein HQL87_13000 [Magnetococcales bacterium]|nr:hypothetical protein [Magnetococcales bacterium]